MYCQVRSCACWSGENTKAVLRSIRKHLSLKTCISQLIVTFGNSIDWFRHDNRFYWKIFNYIFSMSLVIIANLKRIQIIRKGFSANFEQPFVSNMLEVLEETKNLSFFFCQGFLHRHRTIHRTAEEGRGPFFIPLYHFHPLTNIETLICNFACEMTTTYF